MTAAAQTQPAAPPRRPSEVFAAFLRLGVSAFGGPIAHLACYREELVKRRGWLDEKTCADPVIAPARSPRTCWPEIVDGIKAQIPVGRLGLPGEIARCAAFLAGDDTGFITGRPSPSTAANIFWADLGRHGEGRDRRPRGLGIELKRKGSHPGRADERPSGPGRP